MESSLAVFLVVVGVLLHHVATLPPNNQIVVYKNHQRLNSGYQFEYEAEDGSRREEVGTFERRENVSEPVLHVKGTYSYVGGDGRKYVVNYEADDKGTKHEGDFVPRRP